MSAPLVSLRRCFRWCALFTVAKRPSSSAPASRPLLQRFLRSVSQRFWDTEALQSWWMKVKRRRIERKNVYYGYTKAIHGEEVAAAFYTLCLKGGFRYAGQTEWHLADSRGRFKWDFLDHKETPLDGVNMSHTLINYTGLDNLEGQPLRTLLLRGCPEVDDWFLARLHMFQDSLEELDISHCPKITTGGLPALRNLPRLRRLDVSSLQGIKHPGLVIILLEEMFPRCQVIAEGWKTEEENVEPMQECREIHMNQS
ncbi:distal membrane-arm assembly complex protein 2 [Antennarius striatus]|uniref:distal membrane-arm assembly complex protein 2 n=1 Tax=Antennarius striatus TaxID=241820 RepID=UPI0035B31B8C